MLTKNELKYYSSLLLKKNRNEERKFLVEGKKLLIAALNSNLHCELILSTTSFEDANPEFFNQTVFRDLRREIIKQKELEKLSDTKTPQGLIGVFKKEVNKKIRIESKIVVALENISDPGNMGTIIRNCEWFGISDIILSEECAEIFNPKVIRASAGSVFHVNICGDQDFYNIITNLKSAGYKVICGDLEGEDLRKYKPAEKLIIVFANEAGGPSSKILELSDYTITISGKGKGESLNVASATAIILYELSKNL